jgi:hypothetical protein
MIPPTNATPEATSPAKPASKKFAGPKIATPSERRNKIAKKPGLKIGMLSG